MIRVLVADDQKVVRDGLAMILGLLPDIEVVGTAADGDDATRQALAVRPDVVLMDLSMPGCDGVAATRRILEAEPGIRVVVLTTYSDDQWVFAALAAGARGYLTKDAGAEEIRQAIMAVAAGDALLDPSAAAVAGGARRAAGDPVAGGPDRGTRPHRAGGGGTGRGAAGRSNAEIAANLYISEAPVKTHVNHLLAKTGLRDRAQLVGYAFRNGLAW